jgi:hypothetical protein
MTIQLFDELSDGYDRRDQIVFIGVGETYNNMPVLGITVEYPEHRAPLVTLDHGDMVTVLPDCRVIRYTAVKER